VTSDWLEVETREEANGEPGFAFSMIDARHVQSVSALIDAFAKAMNCPTFFGGNLDTAVKQSA
jgi:Barstar (barnase inhibitor)